MDEIQTCQERVQGIMSTEDREESIEDSHTYTATGILSHSMCLITTWYLVIFHVELLCLNCRETSHRRNAVTESTDKRSCS